MRRRHPFRRSALAIALLGALAAAGCDSLPGKPAAADRPVLPRDVKDFAALYGTNCSGCHGEKGTLGAARPLADPLYLALIDDAALRAVIASGVPGTAMPGFAASAGGSLTDAQVDVLVREMRARWGRPKGAAPTTLPPYSAAAALAKGGAPGDPARGEQAYAAFCASCHGPQGKGGTGGGSIVDGAYLALVSDQALRSAVIAGRTDFGMPDYRGAGKTPMTAQQVADVVAWLAAQRPKFPGPGAAKP